MRFCRRPDGMASIESAANGTYFGSVPGCGSAIGNVFVSLEGAGAAGADAPTTGADAAVVLPPVLVDTAARNRCAVLSLLVTSPFMISPAVTPSFL